MNKPEFKLLPCVLCTLGYNTYVAGHRLISKTSELFTDNTQSSNIFDPLAPIKVNNKGAMIRLNKTNK